MQEFHIKKELIFDKVTKALFMFVKTSDFLRRCNALQIGLMAVINKIPFRRFSQQSCSLKFLLCKNCSVKPAFFSPIHLPVIFDAYNTEIILNLPALHALPVFLDRLQQFGIILKEITGHGRFR